MAIDPRAAFDGLIGALEAFHQAATSAQDPEAESVLEASDALAEAYTLYDDVMFTQYEIEAPLDVYPLDEDDLEDDFDDEDDVDDLDDEDDIDEDLDETDFDTPEYQ